MANFSNRRRLKDGALASGTVCEVFHHLTTWKHFCSVQRKVLSCYTAPSIGSPVSDKASECFLLPRCLTLLWIPFDSHFLDTGHTYTMRVGSTRVWDYVGDNFVHRLVQNKDDGKMVEVEDGVPGQQDSKHVSQWVAGLPTRESETVELQILLVGGRQDCKHMSWWWWLTKCRSCHMPPSCLRTVM